MKVGSQHLISNFARGMVDAQKLTVAQAEEAELKGALASLFERGPAYALPEARRQLQAGLNPDQVRVFEAVYSGARSSVSKGFADLHAAAADLQFPLPTGKQEVAGALGTFALCLYNEQVNGALERMAKGEFRSTDRADVGQLLNELSRHYGFGDGMSLRAGSERSYESSYAHAILLALRLRDQVG